jgi:hypothetical protein
MGAASVCRVCDFQWRRFDWFDSSGCFAFFAQRLQRLLSRHSLRQCRRQAPFASWEQIDAPQMGQSGAKSAVGSSAASSREDGQSSCLGSGGAHSLNQEHAGSVANPILDIQRKLRAIPGIYH